jgi:hypothetical protein
MPLFNILEARMDEAVQVPLAALGDAVRAAALPDEGKRIALWCLGQLPPLYAQYQQTRESRYGDDITRLVQGVLKGLAEGPSGGPAAQQLATRFTDCLRLLHEQLGLPGLGLKAPKTVAPRSRKAG